MCSWRYAADIPLRLPKTQLPPTRSDASNTVNGTPRSCSALAAAMPEEPAPMTAAVGSADTGGTLPKVTRASPLLDGGDPACAARRATSG